MKFRDYESNEHISQFAHNAYHDHSFPKYSQDYDQISNYLELEGSYLPSLTLFDDVWELYIESENK